MDLCKCRFAVLTLAIFFVNLAISLADEAAQHSNATLPISDIALDAQGAFHGQVLNAQGKPVAGEVVSIRHARKPTNQVEILAVTNQSGYFRANCSEGGLYLIKTSETLHIARVWTQKAAPPAANPTLLVVNENELIRGNDYTKRMTPTYVYDFVEKHPFLFYSALTTAIVLPIVLINQDDAS